MGTCKDDSADQQEAHQGPMVEENFTTGPPASRTVIDNLKKLLVQRQHSRESDYENKNTVTRSTSGSNSDTAFFSQFSTSSSDSDSDSDSYLIFEDISNHESRKGNSRRRQRRQRSYSSSSSSSRSPVEKRRRKPTNRTKGESNSYEDQDAEENPGLTEGTGAVPDEVLSKKTACSQEDSANSTSSHKDSSSDGENADLQQANEGNNSSTTSNRLPRFKSRRDRNRKRKRSETNYATNRPTISTSTEDTSRTIPTIVISHTDNDVNKDLSPLTRNKSSTTAATNELQQGGNTALPTTEQKPDEHPKQLQ